MALGAFGSLYLENLQGLKTNDLNKIKLMRDLAKENPRQAQDVLKALCQHITSVGLSSSSLSLPAACLACRQPICIAIACLLAFPGLPGSRGHAVVSSLAVP